VIERRYLASEFELRGSAGEGATLAGYAAVFNSPAIIAGMFREQIAPRAFRKTIKESDVRALFNHDPNIVLGRNKAQTLRLFEDEHGLAYEIDLPETQLARDLWTSIERGDISQSSFAFETVKEQVDHPSDDDDQYITRTLRELRLYDISPVTYPAYEDTEVQARATQLMRRWSLPDLRAEAAVLDPPVVEPVTTADPPAPEAVDVSADATTLQPVTEPQTHSAATPEPEPKPVKLKLK